MYHSKNTLDGTHHEPNDGHDHGDKAEQKDADIFSEDEVDPE